MAIDHDKLPGGCFVKQITCNQEGFQLKPGLLAPNGFLQNQTATLLICQDNILITTDPTRQNLIAAIKELQLRQDEINQDFEPAIEATLKTLLG